MASICLLLAAIGSDLVGVNSGSFHITALRHSIRRLPFWEKIFLLLLLTPVTVIPGIRTPSVLRSSPYVRSGPLFEYRIIRMSGKVIGDARGFRLQTDDYSGPLDYVYPLSVTMVEKFFDRLTKTGQSSSFHFQCCTNSRWRRQMVVAFGHFLFALVNRHYLLIYFIFR